MEEQVRYKVICPICKNDFDVAKSMFMEIGINIGSCICPQCKTYLSLECEEETKSMKAVKIESYSERLKKEMSNEKD